MFAGTIAACCRRAGAYIHSPSVLIAREIITAITNLICNGVIKPFDFPKVILEKEMIVFLTFD